MQSQSPQTDAAQVNTVNHSVEQTNTRDFQQQAIGLELAKLVQEARDLDQMLQGLARVVLGHSQCNCLWLGSTNATEESEPQTVEQQICFVTLIKPDTLWQVVENQMRSLTNSALEMQTVCQAPLENYPKTTLIVAPVLSGISTQSESKLFFTGCFSNAEESELRQQWLMSMAAQTISQWQQKRLLSQQSVANQHLRDAFSVVRRLSQSKNSAAVARTLVNDLQTSFACDQVAICFCDTPSSVTVSAISGVEQFDVRSEFATQVIAALQQPLIEEQQLEFMLGTEKQSAAQLALENYCISSGCDAVIALPVSDASDNSIGSVLIGCEEESFKNPSFHAKCKQVIGLVGGQLPTILRANDSLFKTVLGRLEKFKASTNTRNAAIGAAVLFGSLCLPMPYRVWCDCNVQPVEQRFVAAPYDGVLAQSLVRGGDQVSAEQVVAKLDGRALRGELAGVQAEFAVAKKQRDLALATGDVAQSQISKSEMQRHLAKITILNQRLENLDVRSPINGVVVTGDLENAVGIPLELGQTLFEIAPLDTMVAEVGVPESEARYVQAGMKVQLKFDSFPFKTFAAEIQRIHPRAEATDNDSVFVAEVVLENSSGQLRPGMNGTAKISTGWSPVAWNLFHRPWESIRYWTIW